MKTFDLHAMHGLALRTAPTFQWCRMVRDRTTLSLLLKIAVLAAVYAALAKLGLMLDAVSGFATLVWPPTGIALAALLLFSQRLWPGVWVGALVVNLWTGAPLLVAFGIATGNTLEAILGAYLLRHLAGFQGSFNRLRHVMGLLVPVALGSTLISATLGVASLRLGGIVAAGRFLPTWRAWWVGDMLGDLVVAPLLLTWASPFEQELTFARLVEAVFLVGGLLGASMAVFFRSPGAIAYPFESPYVLFPFFVWAALRFELRGATTVTALASALAIWGTVQRHGPFARESLAGSLLALQTFMGCAALTPLVVGGAVADRAKEILERTRTEEALLKSEARFRRLSEAGIIGIITADVHGNILEANNAFLKMVGYTSDELLSGKVRWADMTPSEWRHLDERALEQLKETGIASPWEKEYLRRDGSRVPILVGVAMLDGGAEECVAFVLDQSERKQAEVAIEHLREEREAGLKASIQVRDDFLAIAGHELKTPLAALLMQIQSLQRAVQKEPGSRFGERLGKAESSGLRLERLINQLLDVSRITAGRLRLEPEEVNLSDVVKEVVTRFVEASTKPNCPINMHFEGEVKGWWDRLRVEQVVTNLVSNAVKYGRGKPVEVHLMVNGGDALLRVIDHGIGIDEDHRKRIFQRFERAVATRDFAGFGLGLWITRQIVEASGGKIEVESTLGQGATFTVRLPMRGAEASSKARDATE